MNTFTDLLDNYLLALGTFNHLHMLYQNDQLMYGQEYKQASELLLQAKKALNAFFEPVIVQP